MTRNNNKSEQKLTASGFRNFDVEHRHPSDLPQEPIRCSFLAGRHQDSYGFGEVLSDQFGVGEGVCSVDPEEPFALFVC